MVLVNSSTGSTKKGLDAFRFFFKQYDIGEKTHRCFFGNAIFYVPLVVVSFLSVEYILPDGVFRPSNHTAGWILVCGSSIKSQSNT